MHRAKLTQTVRAETSTESGSMIGRELPPNPRLHSSPRRLGAGSRRVRSDGALLRAVRVELGLDARSFGVHLLDTRRSVARRRHPRENGIPARSEYGFERLDTVVRRLVEEV